MKVSTPFQDGIGAMGRSIVGSSLGPEFDDDPRRWRMIAELVSTCGEFTPHGWFMYKNAVCCLSVFL